MVFFGKQYGSFGQAHANSLWESTIELKKAYKEKIKIKFLNISFFIQNDLFFNLSFLIIR